MNKKEILKIGIWIASFELIGCILGLLTQANIYPWYEKLNKPVLTPPNIVFSIVWPLLYVLLAIVSYWLWKNRKKPDFKTIFNLFYIQLILNWMWSPIFFHFHWMGISFLQLLIIISLSLWIIYISIRNKKLWLGLVLTPYLIWLFFAAYLNFMTWKLN